MLRTFVILTGVFTAPGFLTMPAFAQDDLPNGPGKDVTARICTACHGSEMFSGYLKSKDDWDQTISSMTDKGLSINDADYTTVLGYLSTCLGTASPKVNVNKAVACELTRALGIPAKQAEAIVAYRQKNGDFKDLDGLKKVDGVDATALDKKQAVIAF
jgi:competence protein ComEA